MRNQVFRSFNALKAIAQRVAVLLVTVAMLLNLTQTAAMAANNTGTETRLERSNVTETIPDESDSVEKEQRREWQSKASSIGKEKEPETLGEKLNVEELVEGYDPAREAEKRSIPSP